MFTTTKKTAEDSLHDVAESIRHSSKDTAQAVREDLHDAALQAGEAVRRLMAVPAEEISHASEEVKAQIRNNPVQSSIIALGVGLVIGFLLRGR